MSDAHHLAGIDNIVRFCMIQSWCPSVQYDDDKTRLKSYLTAGCANDDHDVDVDDAEVFSVSSDLCSCSWSHLDYVHYFL